MLNPAWLHTFKTLVDIGHFTKTAQKLNMTQPGVSQHIKKLEDACGHALIKRNTKRLELTEQGRQIYEYAIQLTLNETKLLEALNYDDPQKGICKLACSGSFALKLYPPLLEMQKTHPKLSFELEVAPNHKILADVLEGRTDLGIVTQNPTQSMFDVEKIGREQLCLILPRDVEINPNIAKTIKTLGLIHHPDAAHYLTLYFDLCGEADLKTLKFEDIPKSGYINQLSQILLPVSKGLGFTVLPKSALDNFAEKNKLHVFNPPQNVEETLFRVKVRGRQLPARYNIPIQAICDIC